MPATGSEPIYFNYKFILPDAESKEFRVLLNAHDLSYQRRGSTPAAPWTDLAYHTCTACPLVALGHSQCPVAVNLQDIVHAFSTAISYDQVAIEIETAERNYSKQDVSMQSGLSSILGIIMVTSGCPSLDYLRPMVKTHLPFATISESVYRSISMYLLSQFTRARNGLEPDWTLEGLNAIYDRIDKINISMVRRLQAATEQDASLNAVVILDSFAKMVPLTISGTIQELEDLFWPYLETSTNP